MPHPKELIESIRTKLLEDYPESRFLYEIERNLVELSRVRMAPDITIREKSSALVCLVEIGYTRPEKLKIYRELGVKDVRWYSKAGQLSSDYEKVVTVLRYAPSPQERFHYVLLVHEWTCNNCFQEVLSSSMNPETLGEGETLPTRDEATEAAAEEAASGTYSHVWISDHDRGVAISFCDQCCDYTVHYSGSRGDPIESPFFSLPCRDLHYFMHWRRRQQLEVESLLLSSLHHDWQREWPLPPSNCSFEAIESFASHWFFADLQFDYGLMEKMEWFGQ